MDPKYIIAIDPSLGHTALAVLEDDGTQDGRIIHALGFHTPTGPCAFVRAQIIACEVRNWLVLAMRNNEFLRLAPVYIETPLESTRGMAHKRSATSGPSYGIAVGYIGARVCDACPGRVVPVPAASWTAGIPPTARDPYKERRVRWAEAVWGLKAGALGPKTKAGDLADALFLARWGIWQNRKVRAGGAA